LPHDLPPTGAVGYYFGVWKRDGLDAQINELLRMTVRERAGRSADPSLVVLDSNGRALRTVYASNIFAPQPRYLVR